MRLASLRTGGRDGTLVVVGDDGVTAVPRPGGIASLQAVVEDWARAEPILRREVGRCQPGTEGTITVSPDDLASPLPRAYQWCDGSTYLTHMERLRAARGMALPPDHDTEPIVYQSGSDRFLSPTEPIPLPDEAWGLDLEATVAVVTGDVPQGTRAEDVPDHILLVLLANDLTYRNLMPFEYAKSVGPYLAKPARPYAPIARAAADLAEWDGRLLHATVRSTVRGEVLGELRAEDDCAFDFAELIAYLTRTRSLAAGTIVGSGTLSNRDETRGHGCLAERRAVETLRDGAAATPLLSDGDIVRIEAFADDGGSLFGAIDQRVMHEPTG
jgi:fumarylacetoacetate (FAA) hydrolase